jgi:putative transcriptional regulator
MVEVRFMEKLKDARIKKGYTHLQMATLLNISKPYYWQIENNKRGLSYPMAYKIAKTLNMTPDDLFLEEFKELDK